MQVKARFYVAQVAKNAGSFGNHLSVTLLPVTRKTGDNVDWSKYTPSGKIEMTVSAETGAFAWFEERIGKDVSLTFEDAPEVEGE